MRNLIVISLFFLFSFMSGNLFSQGREHAFEMNKRLGMGINLGNLFEAPSIGEWGVEPDSAYFRDIKNKGFASLRLPVRWSTHAMTASPYTIDKDFMDTIKWAVNLALKNGLPVIINIHHYEEMMTDPAANKNRFLAFWDQISTQFQNYPDSLYFEILNEPNGSLTPALWNQYLAEGLSKIREKNPTRMVIIGTADWGGIGSLSQLQLPDDQNIILTIHYYEPFSFTHQGADFTGQDMPVGITWDSTAVQTAAIANDMNTIKQYAQKNNVPVYMGEFGAIGNADDASRARWIGDLHTVFNENDFSGAYWEYCSGFGVYDPVSDCYHAGMLKALTGYEGACDCSVYDTVIVRNGTFDKSIQPWVLNLPAPESGADAKIELVNGEARMEIFSPGEVNWYIQFLYAPVTLKKGHTYTFLFDAYASSPVTIGTDIGKNYDDYRTFYYRDVNLTTTKQTFVSTFTFDEATENMARINFECGLANVQYLYFDNVHLYENALTSKSKVIPSNCTVKIGENKYALEGNVIKSITIYDISGRIYYHKTYQHVDFLDISENIFPQDIGLIRVETDMKNVVLKSIKR